MSPLEKALGAIAHAARAGDEKGARESLKAARAAAAGETKLEKLEAELSTWESRLSVIFREAAGRAGMAKHAHYWIEELGKAKHV